MMKSEATLLHNCHNLELQAPGIKDKSHKIFSMDSSFSIVIINLRLLLLSCLLVSFGIMLRLLIRNVGDQGLSHENNVIAYKGTVWYIDPS